MKVKKFGLIGRNLSHSFSKKYFNNKFKDEDITHCQYSNYPLKNIEEFPRLIEEEKDLVGLNVTIPYKEKVMPYLDEIDKYANLIGAVNTIRITDGFLKGFNTDFIGFRDSLLPYLDKMQIDNALILGSGGASKAIHQALTDLNITFEVVSRSKSERFLSYHQLNDDQERSYSLIVNCTPLGSWPKVDQSPPIPESIIHPHSLVYDLIYNPEQSRLLKIASARGAECKNGLEMLKRQAEAAWKIWTL